MKVNLVVATGVHEGKVIPLSAPNLLIGRDPECQLRPASPAVSKKHCLISVREGRVYARDLGSTNGTFVNDAQIEDEVEVQTGDRVRIGPLDFAVQIVDAPSKDSTPLPDSLKALDPARAKLSDGAGMRPAGKTGGTPPPMPKPNVGAGLKPGTGEHKVKPGTGEQKPLAAEAPPPPKPKPPTRSEDPDALAAMLLAEDDDSGDAPVVPEGSTVMELPAADVEKLRQATQGGKPGQPAKPPTGGGADSSNAAKEILRKYMQRPK